ncbi:hypothetical protein CRM22_003543 [Opisthorchis felineus]|uniref:ISXO2-like transposase domain-containing protein n=1 Tax=Opisthorchis felineus TaxID=147828 RepID=A0A4S2M0R0_OPIFE|nr:hypothetical protein CRM22_003543 [Opisthorchis felineus]
MTLKERSEAAQSWRCRQGWKPKTRSNADHFGLQTIDDVLPWIVVCVHHAADRRTWTVVSILPSSTVADPMKKPIILQRSAVAHLDNGIRMARQWFDASLALNGSGPRPLIPSTSIDSPLPTSISRERSRRKPVVPAKLSLDGGRPGSSRRLGDNTIPQSSGKSPWNHQTDRQWNGRVFSISACGKGASYADKLPIRKRKIPPLVLGEKRIPVPCNSETSVLNGARTSVGDLTVVPAERPEEPRATLPCSFVRNRVPRKARRRKRVTQVDTMVHEAGQEPNSDNAKEERLPHSAAENQVIVMVDKDFNSVNMKSLTGKTKRKVSEKTLRHRETCARMYDRLIHGLVEIPPEAIRGSSTLETGDRTKAHAICTQVFSHRDDWLNEPGLRLMDFYHLMKDDVRLLCWLARRRLIANRLQCNKGGCVDQLYLIRDTGSPDGWTWRCDSCQNKRSIRHRSIFTHCDMNIRTATQILYLWSVGHPSNLIPCDTDTSIQDTNDWLYCIREVCRETNSELKERIGGLQEDGDAASYCRVVEVDECMFTCWLEDPLVGPTVKEIWLIGGVERGTERTFLARCPHNNRDAFSLVPVIREYVKPGTAVITDDWEGYSPLSQLPEGYLHYVTGRTRGARESEQGAVHIQTVIGHWSHWKRHFESLNGTKVEEFETRLDEYLWRMRHSKAILQSFCYSVTLLFEV